MRGTAAVYIKSESGDDYLYLFVNKHTETVRSKLEEDLECLQPISEWIVEAETDDFSSEVDFILSKLQTKSWQ